jgi:uncharacterized membrane protein YkgB
MDARIMDMRTEATIAEGNGQKYEMFQEVGLPLLRWSLGIIYMWYGILKVIGRSPVADVVAKSLAPLPGRLTVPLMGILEIVIGSGFLTQKTGRLALPFMFLHIAGTFSFFLRRPEESFQGGNPLLLTLKGQFIIKNLLVAVVGFVISMERPKR